MLSRPPGQFANLPDISSRHRDMAKFSSGASFLAVKMHVNTFHREHLWQRDFGILTRKTTEHIDGYHVLRSQGRRSKRPIHHSAEMLLELRRDTTLDAVVTRIVRSCRNLVDQQFAA